MMYYYCCYCYNDMNKKQSVCFSFLRKKKMKLFQKKKIEEKKIKNNYEISVPVLIR